MTFVDYLVSEFIRCHISIDEMWEKIEVELQKTNTPRVIFHPDCARYPNGDCAICDNSTFESDSALRI